MNFKIATVGTLCESKPTTIEERQANYAQRCLKVKEEIFLTTE